MKNIERVIFSREMQQEIESGLDEEVFAEKTLQVYEEQFSRRSQVGKGKAAEVWIGDLPEFKKTICVKTTWNKEASVNTLEKEFEMHERYYQAGVRTPKPFIYVQRAGKEAFEGQGILGMEAINAPNLEEFILEMERKDRQITVEEYKMIIADIREQLRIAHQAGLYHRDLHLKNILIDKDLKVYMIDFGDAAVQLGSDDDVYRSEVSRNGQIVTVAFPKDEQILSSFTQELHNRKLIEKKS